MHIATVTNPAIDIITGKITIIQEKVGEYQTVTIACEFGSDEIAGTKETVIITELTDRIFETVTILALCIKQHI